MIAPEGAAQDSGAVAHQAEAGRHPPVATRRQLSGIGALDHVAIPIQKPGHEGHYFSLS